VLQLKEDGTARFSDGAEVGTNRCCKKTEGGAIGCCNRYEVLRNIRRRDVQSYMFIKEIEAVSNRC
jgi:hypothetical protein